MLDVLIQVVYYRDDRYIAEVKQTQFEVFRPPG
jgi:hypothetical protein